ncbi:hypothetical protein KHA94_19170 [Bacillus sp. FJAT-49705]|uniref:Uncharacterized protein n=1 Tax=Cytobacillus citreus TaxID=2833586 RepID=A0ABS5NWS2_9BACI|nr:hypothetical protein [Cytobacillus citreus]MBS4192287.1 hypothetical protein [Cytobacillus citreus]
MRNKNMKLFGIPLFFLVFGVLFLILGFNGGETASIFSRPPGATSWITSGDVIDAFTFIPMIIGVSFLVLFISTFSISFYKWIRDI